MRIKQQVNCPVCGAWVLDCYSMPDAPQKIVRKTCRNDHDFQVDLGPMRADILEVESCST